MKVVKEIEVKNERKTIDYISLLSVISAIAVVIIHTNGWTFWKFSTDKYWAFSNVIESIFYFAVPVFFMITGVTLIDYRDRYDTKEFFKRRIKKTVVPFICWSIIGVFYQVVLTRRMTISPFNIITIIDGILNTTYVGVYWFFIPLFCVYLFIPLLSAIEKKIRKNVFVYLLICCLIFNSIIPFINTGFGLELNFPITMVMGSEYLTYLIIGYLLHNNNVNRKFEIIIYLLGICGLMLHIVGTYKFSMDLSAIASTMKGYNNIPCVLYSSAVFLFVKNLSVTIKSKSFFLLINTLKRYTFAIYLLHWFVMDLITIIFNPNTRSILYIFGFPLIIIPVCISLTYIIRRMPIVKKILP